MPAAKGSARAPLGPIVLLMVDSRNKYSILILWVELSNKQAGAELCQAQVKLKFIELFLFSFVQAKQKQLR